MSEVVSDLGLTRGDLIVAKARASNVEGTQSNYSEPNGSGAVV
jgi:hypothetical protein